MSTVRRSSRVAAMKDEIDYTGKKVLKAEPLRKATTVKKATATEGKTSKSANKDRKSAKSKKESEVIDLAADQEKGSKGNKRGRRGKQDESREPPLKKVAKSKSRSAKKEDAVIIDDSEGEGEGEDEDDLETKDRKDSTDNKEKDDVDEDEEFGELEVGKSIPSKIELILEDSSKINLKEFAKKVGILVIFAYPKASTPGCTRQANGFRDEYKELKGLNAEVLGLSSDNEKAQSNFKSKHELPYHLICDVKRELIKLLGCRKTVVSGTIRSHFIFVDGILKVKEIKISPENSFNKALEYVKSLK